MTYLLGIDGGGTGCRAALADLNGRILGIGKSGAANVMTDMDMARGNIMDATDAAFASAGIDKSHVGSLSAVLGLAGANVGDNAANLKASLPFKDALVLSDGLIALQGAIGNNDGTVVILGTGSLFIAREGDKVQFAGGWGFKVGDLGGGARLGRHLLEETLLAYDRFRPASELTQAVMQRYENNPHNIVRFAHAATPSDFGTLVPMIFDYAAVEDAVALAILQTAIDQIEQGLDTIMSARQTRLSLLGGLGPLYEKRLSTRYQEKLQKPLNDALAGAVQLAVLNFASKSAECIHV
ncbi:MULTISPECIES: BadF/BadG/BcrA/BcrD ATPase family protein [unclassified Phyllobacterium]|uniref:BadF/BadG/BcrA/BcrD ATPase family protein n=1 Tax=unclassified Phyllobacterium TaxID=2638441 RepID=UPI003012FC36